MAIRVGHGLNAGAVAGAAFGGAQGQARAALTTGRLAARERDLRRKQQLEDEERQRQFQIDQQARAYGLGQLGADAAQLRTQENMRLNTELQGQLATDAFGRHEASADAAQLRGRSDLEFGLTTRQRMELDQLANAEAAALSDPSYSPDEKAELRYRFAQKRAGINPVARPKPKSPAELFAERTHTDPRTGRVYSLDENGMPGRAIYEPPERMATVQDRVKAWSEALKAAATPEGGVDEAKARKFYEMIMSGQVPDSFGASPAADVGAPAGAMGFVELQRLAQQVSEPSGSLTASEPDLSTLPGMEQAVATLDKQIGLNSDLRSRYLRERAQEQEAASTPSRRAERRARSGELAQAYSDKRAKEAFEADLKKVEDEQAALLAQRDRLQGILAAQKVRQLRAGAR